MSKHYMWPKRPLPYEWEWPENVPRTYDGLFRDYERYVTKTIVSYNRMDRDLPDLLQEVWSKVISSHLLEKVAESAAARFPGEISVREALNLLGLTEDQWFRLLNAYRRCNLPKPVTGPNLYSMDATMRTRDVANLDRVFGKVRRGRRFRSKFISNGFFAYFRTSIHNYFSNWCRTQHRRQNCYREMTMRPQRRLQAQTGGYYTSSTSSPEDTLESWEDSVAMAMTVDVEDHLDLVQMIRKANIDTNTPEGIEVCDYLADQGKRSGGVERNLEVLRLLGLGYTFPEAVQRMKTNRQKILQYMAS